MVTTDSKIARIVQQVVQPLRNRVLLMASRGVVKLIENSGMQRLQVTLLAGEAADDVEHFQPYGFASRPPAGSEAIVLSIGGDRSHLVAVVVSDRSSRWGTSPAIGGEQIAPEDSALYSTWGNRVHVKATGDIAAVPGNRGGTVHLGEDDADAYVSRIGDTVSAATGMATWMGQVAGYINGLVPGTVSPAAPSDFGTIATGASKVKAT